MKMLPDEAVIARVRAGEVELFEILIRRYNQRLYRTAMAIIHDPEEAQEVLQEVYLKAYEHLSQFAGKAQFSTWLTRIAVNESLARLAKRRKVAEVDWSLWEDRVELAAPQPAPEQRLLAQSMQAILENAIGRLAPSYRAVFVLREIEKLSTSETAVCLEISEPSVKVRLHRARAFLRQEIQLQAGVTGKTLYEFMGDRCDQIVLRVMETIKRRDEEAAHES